MGAALSHRQRGLAPPARLGAASHPHPIAPWVGLDDVQDHTCLAGPAPLLRRGWPGEPLEQTTDLAAEALEDQRFIIGWAGLIPLAPAGEQLILRLYPLFGSLGQWS